jgi:hypothetical protein
MDIGRRMAMAEPLHEEPTRATEPIEIGNEFAFVRVRKVWTRNGERLEVTAPKLGYAIRLDSMELESLTWQTTETFSKFLETPFGPEGERLP